MGAFSSPEEINQALSLSATHTLDPNDPAAHPGLFDEFFSGIGSGIEDGGLGFANAANRTSQFYRKPIARALDSVLGTDIEGAQRRQSNRLEDATIANEQEGATTMGGAGHLAKGLANIATEVGLSAVTGVPIPLGVGLSEGVKTYDFMREQGVDKQTAFNMGGLSAGTNALFTVIPGSVGLKKVIPDLAASIGLVDTVGIASRGLNSAVLENAGYPEMAKNYQAFDSQAMIADTLLSGFFHGMARHADYFPKPLIENLDKAPISKVDEALQVKEARHQDTDTAPGVPADINSFDAHINAMEEVLKAAEDGREPNFDDTGIYESKFVRDPVRENQHAEIEQEINSHIFDEGFIPTHETEAGIPVKDLGENNYQTEDGIVLNRDADWMKPIESPTAGEVPGKSTGEVTAEPYQVTAARQALAENPDLTIGIGEGQTAKASDILAQHDAEIQQANELSNLIEIVATCSLRA